MTNSPVRLINAVSMAWLLAWGFLGVAPSQFVGAREQPQKLSAFVALIDRAESSLVRGNTVGARELYQVALNEALTFETTSEDGRESWGPEVKLGLLRLARLGRAVGDPASDHELLLGWSRRTDIPELSALARLHLGFAQVRMGDSLEEARATWSVQLHLEAFQIIGPFDNERGGGFSTTYAPEEAIDLAASYDGKTRKVTWRPLPARPLAGNIDLGALLDPNEESLAYAVTYLFSQIDQAAALRIGSKGGFRAWINGALVGSEDVKRPFRREQNRLGIWLRKGWNRVLLKLAHSEGDWRFAARVSRPDGRPLEGVREGLPDDLPLTYREERPSPPVAGGSVAQLRERTTEDNNNPGAARNYYLLGALLLEVHAHDDGDHPDAEALMRSIQLRNDRPITHILLADSRKRRTTMAAQQEENAWRRAVERAAELGSESAHYRLAEYYVRQFGNHARATDHLAKALAGYPQYENAIDLQGRIESERSYPRAKEHTLSRLRQLPQLSAYSHIRLARDAARRGALDEAIAKLKGIVERDGAQLGARRLVAQLLARRSSGLETALAVLRRGTELQPYSTEWHLSAASMQEGYDRLDEAVASVDAALRVRPDDAAIHERRGRLLLRSFSHDTALRSFDEALRLQPNSPELRQYVDFLRQRGSEFEDLFRREATPIVAAALGKGGEQPTDATSAAADSDAPAHILLELEAIRLHTDGTTKLFSQNLVKILNNDGVRRYDAFSTYYAPGEQVVEFKVARVHHVDGRVSNAELSRFSGEATEDAQYEPATIDLPPLAAGDVVEVEYVREQVQQSFFGDYFGHREVFQKALPVDEKTFILQVQDGRKVNFHERNLNVKPTTSRDADSKTETFRWTVHDIPKLETEPGMPPSTEVSPVLEMSTFATWREFSTWYYNLIRKQFESNPEIRRKVLELTSGAEDDLAKIRTVYNFVVTQIRYNMWEFGVHGFKPFNATSIFARRFGDCKDKATLMSVMLNEVGIDAYPVLIFGTQARADEDLTLPLVNHFNHCISYVPPSGDHGPLYLDGTAQHHSLDDLPSMDRGARVLIVTPDGGDLNEVPWNESSNLSLEEETTIALSDDLSADFHTRVSVKGDYAVYIRNAFEIAGQRSVQLERLFSRRFAASSVESQEFSKLDDLNQPVTFVARLKIPRFVTESSTGLVLRAERDFFSTCTQLTALSSLEERKFDLLLGNPRVSALRTIYRLPPTLGLKSLPPAREMTTTFGRFSINYTAPEPQQIVVERQIEITSPRVSIDSYEAFREFAAALKRLEDQQVLLTRN